MRGADEKLDIRGVRIGVRDEIKWNKIRALELYFSGKLSVRAINVYWGYREVGDGQMERTVPCYAPLVPDMASMVRYICQACLSLPVR